MVTFLHGRPAGGHFKAIKFFINYTSHTIALNGAVARPHGIGKIATMLGESSALRRHLKRGDIALFLTDKEAEAAALLYKRMGKKVRKSLAEWYAYSDAVIKEAATKIVPAAEPKKAEPKKEEPKKAEPKKEEPKKEEPKKEEPKKEEPKKAEPKKEEPKKEAPKKKAPAKKKK